MRKVVPSVPQRQFVCFRLGGSELALDVFGVQEVLRYQAVTPLPRAPEFVEGMIEVRGALIPVIDLRRRFEVADLGTDGETRILLVSTGMERVGLLVDRVTEVLRVPETSVAPPPPYLHQRAAAGLVSVVRLPDRMILVLDIDPLLSTDERIALRDLEAALAEAEAAAAADLQAEPNVIDAADLATPEREETVAEEAER